MPLGVSVGAGLLPQAWKGLLIGGEATLVHLDTERFVWLGGCLHAERDFGRDAWRLSLGPEAGVLFTGVDLGPSLELRQGLLRLGAQARLVLSVSYFTCYLRLAHLGGPAETTLESGIMLKFPFPVALTPNRAEGPFL